MLKEILSANLNDSNAETALYRAMVIPHLILTRTRKEDDTSNNKTVEGRLYQWLKSDIEFLFPEAKSIQQRMSRTKANLSFDEYK